MLRTLRTLALFVGASFALAPVAGARRPEPGSTTLLLRTVLRPDFLQAPAPGLDAPGGLDSLPPSPAHARLHRLLLPREEEGPLLAQDHLLHASISYSMCFTLRAAGARPSEAALATAALGLAKELHDSLLRPAIPGQGMSRLDLLSDAAGLGLALLAAHRWLKP